MEPYVSGDRRYKTTHAGERTNTHTQTYIPLDLSRTGHTDDPHHLARAIAAMTSESPSAAVDGAEWLP
jgi:hypothetical protein